MASICKILPKNKITRYIIRRGLPLEESYVSINRTYYDDELKDVLIGLGYKEKELKPVLAKVDTSLPIEGQVKDALKLLLR